MASFPPMIIPVTSSFNIPVQSTLSYEHNETLPSAVIQRFPVFRAGGDRAQFVRKGGLVAILDCNPKTSRKVSKSNESSYIAIEGEVAERRQYMEGLGTVSGIGDNEGRW